MLKKSEVVVSELDVGFGYCEEYKDSLKGKKKLTIYCHFFSPHIFTDES